eukprot:2086375-Pleurochrysis_carterae.AAC.1
MPHKGRQIRRTIIPVRCSLALQSAVAVVCVVLPYLPDSEGQRILVCCHTNSASRYSKFCRQRDCRNGVTSIVLYYTKKNETRRIINCSWTTKNTLPNCNQNDLTVTEMIAGHKTVLRVPERARYVHTALQLSRRHGYVEVFVRIQMYVFIYSCATQYLRIRCE